MAGRLIHECGLTPSQVPSVIADLIGDLDLVYSNNALPGVTTGPIGAYAAQTGRPFEVVFVWNEAAWILNKNTTLEGMREFVTAACANPDKVQSVASPTGGGRLGIDGNTVKGFLCIKGKS